MSVKKDVMLLRSSLYLTATIRNGKISRTADENGIKASNLSQILKELESTLGVPLLIRKKNGVEATPEGMEIYNVGCRVEKSLSDFNRIKSLHINKRKLNFYAPEDCFIDLSKFIDKEIRIQRVKNFSNADIAVFIGDSRLKNGYIQKKYEWHRENISINLSIAIKASNKDADKFYKFLIASEM